MVRRPEKRRAGRLPAVEIVLQLGDRGTPELKVGPAG
jgi:hypothetical protein